MFCCWGTKYSLYSHDALYSYVWPEGVTLQMCMVKKGKKKGKKKSYSLTPTAWWVQFGQGTFFTSALHFVF